MSYDIIVNDRGDNMIKCVHELFNKLWFENEDERDTFYDYLDYKGVFLHKQVYEAFLSYKDKVTYKELSTYIKYDKGLRNVLYRNLSAVEEYYRSKLINNFDVEKEIDDPINSLIKNSELIKTNGKSYNLYRFSFSKHFTMDRLLNLLNSKNLITVEEFNDLDKLRIFRNKVMHHNLIVISYHEDKEVIENEISYVEEMCELIYKYLPVPMRNAFQGNVNKCNHLTRQNRVPNLEILCLREMKNGVFK